MKDKIVHLTIMFIGVLFLCTCKPNDSELFNKLSATHTGINFTNTITESDSINILNYYYCYNGGGVGIGDFNNDGLPDVFFTGNMVSSKLYLNKGKMQFEDITLAAGLSTSEWIMGVSVIDINNDGWMDIYLNVAGPNTNRKHHNLLFINQGLKNGAISFKEQAAAYGLNDSSFCVQSAFLDYDRDGDLDMYLLTNDVDGVEKTFVNPAAYPITRGRTVDKLYENIGDSDGHPIFKNVSKQAGITEEGYGLGLAIADLNGDGWPDVYASNDFMPNDQMLINQKNKTFKESAAQNMRHQTYNGMGVDIADINNDGKADIMVLDMLPPNNERRKTMIARADNENFSLRKKAGYVDEYMRNTLQLNQGTAVDGTTYFSDIAQLAGVNATDWSWSVLLADFDNDGWRDCYITNGFAKNITDLDFLSYNADNNTFGSVKDKIKSSLAMLAKLKGIHVSNYIFKNNGHLGFEDLTEKWGLKKESFSNGAAYADFDNDGDLDIITNNINEQASIYENKATDLNQKNNFLRIALKGSGKNVNGIGATITLFCGDQILSGYNSPVKGYLSSMNMPLSFGLGKHNVIDSIKILWPDGKIQFLKNIKVNQQITADYSAAQIKAVPSTVELPLFIASDSQYNIHYKHEENEFNDFNEESLLPKMYSKKGPAIAVGNFNGAHTSGFFIGGAAGNAGTLFTQSGTGTFTQKNINTGDAKFEDAGALFFDADNDGDDDLYVVSGGNEFKNVPGAYQDRLYINDGKGNFTKNEQALPLTTSSGSCVIGADFDKDGDIDLFRAGRNIPGSYPLAPRSYLLKNEKGKFVDVTKEVAPGLMEIGMITSAVWSDFDNDGWIDLIVTGEWMQPTFFKNEHGKFVNVTEHTGLTKTNGWWNSIYAVDIDNDGDMDYIVGNMGTNIDFKPAANEPMELYYDDFTGNGKKQPVISCYVMDENGKKNRYPFSFRDDLFKVMPGLKKKFWNYELFGKATLDDVFKSSALSKAKHLQADIFESCILENKGNGKFICRPLPVEAQLSCINGIIATDVNGDGNIDLVVAGNSHATEVVYGWMDASLGLLLMSDGKGNFKAVAPQKSGLFLKGDIRGLATLFDNKGKEILLAPANSDSLKVLSFPNKIASKIFYANPLDAYAEIIFKDGRKTKQEFYYGNGYLSQSARVVKITDRIANVEITDTRGIKRKIKI